MLTSPNVAVVLIGPGIVRAGCQAHLGEDPDIVVLASVDRLEAVHDLTLSGERPIVLVAVIPAFDPGAADPLVKFLADRRFAAVLPVLTVADQVQARQVLTAGAAGCVLLEDGSDDLINAIKAAASGDLPLSVTVRRWLVQQSMRTTTDPIFTHREREVLELVGVGLANKQIAYRLGISTPTVKHHLTRVYERIGVASRTEAALWLRQQRGTPSAFAAVA